MYARALDEAVSRLRELRGEERQNLGLAAVSLGLAIAATQVRPDLAMPFLLGGLVVCALGIRALLRRSFLVEQLAREREAHVIPEVHAYALREATMERRRGLATLIRGRLREPTRSRVGPDMIELEALACELEDEGLSLDPVCAIACSRLLSEPDGSPLLNRSLPSEDLFSQVRQIRAGFEPVVETEPAPQPCRQAVRDGR
jgi:hypothetical protein